MSDSNGDTQERLPRDKRPRKDKRNTDFWRACRYLYPYRKIVATSIVCALFVGAAFTGGLGTMLPIMRVLLNGDTIQSWANREIAEKRLAVEFSDESADLRVLRIKDSGPGVDAGLKAGDVIASTPETAFAVLMTLAQPDDTQIKIPIESRGQGFSTVATVKPLPWYLGAGQRVASVLPTHPVGAIACVFALVASLAVISNVIKFFQEYYSDKAAIMAVQDIRRRMYDHVLHVPMSHFGSRGTSDITSRLTQDSQELAQGFKTVLGQSIQEPIKALFAFSLALWVSWKVTLFIVIFAPVMFVIIKKFGKKMGRANRKALVNSSQMLGQIEGTLSGIRVVKGASAERFERRRYARIMKSLVHEQLRMSRIDAFSGPTMETLTLFVVGAIVLFASYMVLISHTLEATSFILIMACLGGIGDSLRRVSKVNNVLQKSNAAAARIFEVMDLPVERRRTAWRVAAGPPTPSVKIPPLQREVRFENITFAYANTSGPALVNVNLTVQKGTSIAIVGRNGSGKTTLLALLPRFYEPQQGRVLIDDVDVRQATLRSLRGQISIVTQDSVIFPGTIHENIAYGYPLASRDAVIAAAKRAFAHDFIMDKPQGYDTMLGELGGQLSGGQKQRVCIARAIFRNAAILILDEATSQVDAESEHLIQQAIDVLIHERREGAASSPTTFVIAHRFSTILGADTIVVMDKGQIVGQGKHEELLRTCETYQQLYERQLIAAPVVEVAAS